MLEYSPGEARLANPMLSVSAFIGKTTEIANRLSRSAGCSVAVLINPALRPRAKASLKPAARYR
jgi:hypothetical protein